MFGCDGDDVKPDAVPHVGVFDSGVGGLTVLRELRLRLKNVPITYVADQAHAPYGALPLSRIESYVHAMVAFMQEQGATMVVLACNTASAAALYSLRSNFPSLPIVGMEPAIKPAAHSSVTGHIAVMATKGTFEGAPYAKVLREFARNVTVHPIICTGLVDLIEAGKADAPETHKLLESWLTPVLAQGVDRIVLGCTHYPFVRHVIASICGPSVEVIDPASAIARRVEQLLDNSNQSMGAHTDCYPVEPTAFFTTKDQHVFRRQLATLMDYEGEVYLAPIAPG